MQTAILIVLVLIMLTGFRVVQYLHHLAKNQVQQAQQAAILNTALIKSIKAGGR